jgi:hypothetical protein
MSREDANCRSKVRDTRIILVVMLFNAVYFASSTTWDKGGQAIYIGQDKELTVPVYPRTTEGGMPSK